MTSPVETTAAMTPPAEHGDPADISSAPGMAAPGGAAAAAVAGVSDGAGEQTAHRGELSPNVVVALFGGLVTTLLGALIGLMMWQFSSLGARIDAQGARIDDLGKELRAEMQAGFAEVHAVLLDHTDRLARLETAAGLPRIGD